MACHHQHTTPHLGLKTGPLSGHPHCSRLGPILTALSGQDEQATFVSLTGIPAQGGRHRMFMHDSGRVPIAPQTHR